MKVNQLKVTPLMNGYRPKYPSYFDKNPLDYPNSRPYPFSLKFIDAMSVAGFVGAVMFSTGCYSQNDSIKQQILRPLQNSFPVSCANIPYSPAMYGTGLPRRLNREDAIEVINNVFKSEGLNISKDTLISRKNINIKANAYNKKYNIGYIWMDFRNSGEGILKNWHFSQHNENNFDSQVNELKKRLVINYNSYIQDSDNFFRYRKGKLAEELKQDLNSNLARIDRQYFIKRYGKFKFQKYLSKLGKYNLHKSEEKWIDDLIKRVDDNTEAYAMIYLFRNVVMFFKYADTSTKSMIYQEINDINDMHNIHEWEKRSKLFINSLENIPNYYNYHRDDKFYSLFAEIITKKPWQERKNHFDLIDKYIDSESISLDEVNILEKAAENKEYFIAPISQRDNRTIIPEFNSNLNTLRNQYRLSDSQTEKDSIRKIMDIEIEDYYSNYEKNMEESKLEVLKRLEIDVRNYIKWAKFQQGY